MRMFWAICACFLCEARVASAQTVEVAVKPQALRGSQTANWV
jgi:hypothetical protein